MVAKDILEINPKSNIAVATLWSRKELVLSKLESRDKVNIIGTLYTSYGINYLIHTLAKRPEINVIVLFGADLSGVGDSLIDLVVNRRAEGFRLLWDMREIREILDNIKIIDLREYFRRGDWGRLERVIEEYFDPSGPKRRVVDLRLEEPLATSWPIPVSGFSIHEDSPFRAWVKAVYAVLRYGVVKECEYGERQSQVLNLMVSLDFYGKEDIVFEDAFYRYISKSLFDKHFKSLTEPVKPEGVSYTYGERIFSHPSGGDQYEVFIDKLKRSPYTRRAIIVLWDHSRDRFNDNPPCITVIQGDVSGDYYNHTVYIRSNDIYSAWPLNIYGQIKFAQRIAGELSCKLGVVTMISSSAHIYEHDWSNAWKLVRENMGLLSEFVPDPRGNFILYKSNNVVVVEHRTPDGLRAKVMELKEKGDYYELKREAGFISSEHAFYLGWEARRAFEKLRRDEDYYQDKA